MRKFSMCLAVFLGIMLLFSLSMAQLTTVVNANQDLPGLDTGIDLTSGDTFTITALGEASFGTGSTQACSTSERTVPDGQRITADGTLCPPKIDPSVVLPSAPVGTLIANIGSSGWFAVDRPNWPLGLAHFLGLLIGVQNPASMGILGQKVRVQKPGKEFGPKTAFLDSLGLLLGVIFLLLSPLVDAYFFSTTMFLASMEITAELTN